MKKCPKCNRILPDSYFAPNTPHCRLCRRDYDWQYRYGLSPEQYYELWLKQEGKCAICGQEMKEETYLRVDHDEQTGEVRGLLCDSCNKGLGFFRDNVETLQKAIEYLKENQCQEQ
jgi:hypothetical protein